ncbi:hypothetical protein K0U07_04175, partial [bacterium]|nr:hypothetical protein [bacterium]
MERLGSSGSLDGFVLVEEVDCKKPEFGNLFKPVLVDDDSNQGAQVFDYEVIQRANAVNKWLSTQPIPLHILLPGEDVVTEEELERREALFDTLSAIPTRLEINAPKRASLEIRRLLTIAKARFGVLRNDIAVQTQPIYSQEKVKETVEKILHQKCMTYVFTECLVPAGLLAKGKLDQSIAQFQRMVFEPA